MPLPSSGPISLNEIHVEAGGTSGTECSINDSDIRALINLGSTTVPKMFSSWYGASAALYTGVCTIAQSAFKTSTYFGLNSPGASGAMTPSNVPFVNNGNAYFALFRATRTGSAGNFSYSFGIQINNVGTDNGDNGFTQLVLPGITLTRAGADLFQTGSSTTIGVWKSWFWFSGQIGSTNPWGSYGVGQNAPVSFL